MFCFFTSDIHGKVGKYEKLFTALLNEKPDALFLGGDLLPHSYSDRNFIADYLFPKLSFLKKELKEKYPSVFLILGNDDAKCEEPHIHELEKLGLLNYIHLKKAELNEYKIFGYSFTPPSPFLLKDWEKYDVSRYVEPGCISPEDGKRTVDISTSEKKFSTIKEDLNTLSQNEDFMNAIVLFHGPPYNTALDRAALDNKKIDHVNLDVHVGSFAIRKFIEEKQPLVTLHGHIHESTRLTGKWYEKIGRTYCFGAAHSEPELALIKFQTKELNSAEYCLM
jgi:uncharacterized protein